MKPLEKVPEIQVKTLQGQDWALSLQRAKNFIMIVFYRGHHCRVCRHYIHDLSVQLTGFKERGVEVIAISGDKKEKALQSQSEWHTQDLLIGYGYPVEEAKKLGLYISKGINKHEPDFFFEPGIFIIKPDGTLFSLAIQSLPFARPHFNDIINSIDVMMRENHEPRGEV